MKVFRRHIVFRIICCLLAVHIFNISVDMPDANPDDVAEDLTINDQETIVELVLEKCIGIEDAIAEHDEPGDESQNFEMTKEFQLYTHDRPLISFSRSYIELDILISEKIIRLPSIVSDIVPPPPKA
jgi:hypothetical protein